VTEPNGDRNVSLMAALMAAADQGDGQAVVIRSHTDEGGWRFAFVPRPPGGVIVAIDPAHTPAEPDLRGALAAFDDADDQATFAEAANGLAATVRAWILARAVDAAKARDAELNPAEARARDAALDGSDNGDD
jgi:hypothetical protein